MKLSKQTILDLLVLMHHAKRDISFDEGGSYTCEDKKGNWIFDKKEAKQADRAINFIIKLIKEHE